MSLRVRLIATIAAILLIVLAGGGLVTCWSARAQVRAEMRGALGGAQDIVREAQDRADASAMRAALVALVHGFDGQRHIGATALDAGGRVIARSRIMPPQGLAPVWFRNLIGVPPQSVRLAFDPAAPAGPMLLISTDPTNEIDEVWRQSSDAFAALTLFSGGACLAIYLIVGGALGRFSAFDSALRAVGDGRYDTTLAEQGSPEFVALARGFNRMSRRIREFEARNRELLEQMLTLQAEERAQIARDLHDEVGPYLFAIKVDAGDIPRLVRAEAVLEAAERAGSIREAADHIHRHVREILRQLRPNDALEFGLEAAVADLLSFWRRRYPATSFELRCDIAAGPIERQVEDAAYRVVQESLSNAIRHGRPDAIMVTLETRPDEQLAVSVSDNGRGLSGGRSGLGLAGMAERVRGLGGAFEVAPIERGGVRTSAVLPARTRPVVVA